MFDVDFPVIPQKMALLNVDMQNVFVHGYPISAPDGLEVEKRINELAAKCREAGITVIHCSHVVRPDGSNIGVMAEILPPVRDGLINKGSQSAALHEGLDVKEGDIFLDKPRFGAFHSTDLEMLLRNRGIDTVMVTGICTNICCETTAREANVRDFRVFFLRDGTATFDMGDLSKEELQAATCATLGACFAQIVTVDEMIAKIDAASAKAAAAE